MSSEFNIPTKTPTSAKLDSSKLEGSQPGTEPETEAKTEGTKYDKEELARIFDELIFSGEYVEDVTLRGSLKVRFRTRNGEEVDAIQMALDAARVNLISTVDQKRSFLYLKSSLAAYNGKDMSTMKDEEKTKFLNQLPAPVIGLLLQALEKFDDKIREACREGEENF